MNRKPIPDKQRAFDNLREALQGNEKRPYIGLTQGGSSRKDAGSKSAATNGLVKSKRSRKNG